MKADNDDRLNRQSKEKRKPTGGGFAAQQKRMEQNKFYENPKFETVKKKVKKDKPK